MKKTEADGIKKITTSFLKKHDYFIGFRSGTITWTRSGMWGEHKSSVGISVSISNEENYLRINYTQTDNDTNEKQDFDYKIPLTTTPCHYGGKRYWFICPWHTNGKYCGRRVGALYKDGDYFACRHCYNLSYSSRNVNRRYKLFCMFNTLTLEQKVEELEKQIKRPYYQGKPTKKQAKLIKFQNQLSSSYQQTSQLRY